MNESSFLWWGESLADVRVERRQPVRRYMGFIFEICGSGEAGLVVFCE